MLVALGANSPAVSWAALETSTATIIDAGETVSTPTPHPMTAPPETSFVTLTRSPLAPANLPPQADTLYPDEARAYDAQNVGEALFHRLGVLIQPQGSPGYPMNVRIRGADAKQTLVLIDGRPVEGAALGAADLSEIP